MVGWFHWEGGCRQMSMSARHLGKAVLSASGWGSSRGPGPSSATSSLGALNKSPSLSRTQFSHPEKGALVHCPWKSHHISLVQAIGQTEGNTLSLLASGLGLYPLGLGRGMSFLPGSQPRSSCLDLRGGGAEPGELGLSTC